YPRLNPSTAGGARTCGLQTSHALPAGLRFEIRERFADARVHHVRVEEALLREHLHEDEHGGLELRDLLSLITIELEEVMDLLLDRRVRAVELVQLVDGVVQATRGEVLTLEPRVG